MMLRLKDAVKHHKEQLHPTHTHTHIPGLQHMQELLAMVTLFGRDHASLTHLYPLLVLTPNYSGKVECNQKYMILKIIVFS